MHMKTQEVMRFRRDEMPSCRTLHTNELLALAEKTDNAIDYSYIPETTEEQWNDAVRGKF